MLEAVDNHGVEIDACLRCGGLWFDAGELNKAIRSHNPEAVAAGLLADSVSESVGLSRLACPSCKLPLRQHHLSKKNPVIIEICRDCSGIWLPHGQIERAQAGHQLANAHATIDSDRSWSHWLFQFFLGLPVEFNIKPRKTPIVTYSLIALNVLIFAMTWFLLMYAVEFDPQGSTRSKIWNLALYPSRIGEFQWFGSLISSQFLHAGIVHLLGNMYFLWILGDNVEDLLGRAKFLVFYLAAGVVGGIVYSLLSLSSNAPVIGASGAVSGVLGTYVVFFRKSKLTFMLVFWQFKLAAPFYIGIWVLLNLVGWLLKSPGIAWAAHLGGFIFGLAIAIAGYQSWLCDRPLLRLLNGHASNGRGI